MEERGGEGRGGEERVGEGREEEGRGGEGRGEERREGEWKRVEIVNSDLFYTSIKARQYNATNLISCLFKGQRAAQVSGMTQINTRARDNPTN